MEENSLLYDIKNIEKKYWITSSWWILYAVFFGLLPTWITIILLPLFNCNLTCANLIDDGQFALYSTALLSAGWYFIGRDFKETKFPGRHIFIIIFCILGFISSLLVTGVILVGETSLDINYAFLRISSIAIFIISIPFVVIAAAKNEAGIVEDVKTARIKQEENLINEFDKQIGN